MAGAGRLVVAAGGVLTDVRRRTGRGGVLVGARADRQQRPPPQRRAACHPLSQHDRPPGRRWSVGVCRRSRRRREATTSHHLAATQRYLRLVAVAGICTCNSRVVPPRSVTLARRDDGPGQAAHEAGRAACDDDGTARTCASWARATWTARSTSRTSTPCSTSCVRGRRAPTRCSWSRPRRVAARARRTLSLARAGAPGSHRRGARQHPASARPLGAGRPRERAARRRFSAGQLLVACEAIERSMLAGAVLGSLTRLAAPGAPHEPAPRVVVAAEPLRRAHPPAAADRPRRNAVWSRVPLPPPPGPVHVRRRPPPTSPATSSSSSWPCASPGTAPPSSTPPTSRADAGAPSASPSSAPCRRTSAGLVQDALAAAVPCRSCGAPVVWPSCRFCHARSGTADGEPTSPLDPTDRGDR